MIVFLSVFFIKPRPLGTCYYKSHQKPFSYIFLDNNIQNNVSFIINGDEIEPHFYIVYRLRKIVGPLNV